MAPGASSLPSDYEKDKHAASCSPSKSHTVYLPWPPLTGICWEEKFSER